MTCKNKIAALAIPLTMVLGASGAFAKAHDQGVADGTPLEQNTGAFIQSLDIPGVSAVVNDGARGDGASASQGGNRTEPVDQPGQNVVSNDEPN